MRCNHYGGKMWEKCKVTWKTGNIEGSCHGLLLGQLSILSTYYLSLNFGQKWMPPVWVLATTGHPLIELDWLYLGMGSLNILNTYYIYLNVCHKWMPPSLIWVLAKFHHFDKIYACSPQTKFIHHPHCSNDFWVVHYFNLSHTNVCNFS